MLVSAQKPLEERAGVCFRLLLNYFSTTESSDRAAALQFILLKKKTRKSIIFKKHTKDAVKLGGDSEQSHR